MPQLSTKLVSGEQKPGEERRELCGWLLLVMSTCKCVCVDELVNADSCWESVRVVVQTREVLYKCCPFTMKGWMDEGIGMKGSYGSWTEECDDGLVLSGRQGDRREPWEILDGGAIFSDAWIFFVSVPKEL